MTHLHKHSGCLHQEPSAREQAHARLARRAAAAGIVLLKNTGILPLDPAAPIALLGAGAGRTVKGGIGSASRVLTIAGKTYTLGVLVQSNHGCLEELTVCGRRLGEEIIARRAQTPEPEPNDRGSIMMITATDLPVSDRQLRRIIKRCAVGLARCGSYFGHGSGDVMIGFTTQNRVPHGGMHRVLTQQVLTEHTLELAFRAIAEATQEAVLNSLCCADDVRAEDGTVYEGIGRYL